MSRLSSFFASRVGFALGACALFSALAVGCRPGIGDRCEAPSDCPSGATCIVPSSDPQNGHCCAVGDPTCSAGPVGTGGTIGTTGDAGNDVMSIDGPTDAPVGDAAGTGGAGGGGGATGAGGTGDGGNTGTDAASD
jgi:hypothetical protein